MQPPDDNTEWIVDCSRARFLVLASRADFACLIRLSRHVNALRFGQSALVHANEDDGPVGRRSRPGAFFYNGSVLFEALGLLPELRMHFESHAYWARSFGRFGSDDEVRALIAQGTDLHRLRNHVGFHVLGIVPERSLPTLELPGYVLASGLGTLQGHVYYDMGDTIALHYLLGSPKTFELFMREFETRGSKVTEFLTSFLEASDKFLPHALQSMGLSPRIVPPAEGEPSA